MKKAVNVERILRAEVREFDGKEIQACDPCCGFLDFSFRSGSETFAHCSLYQISVEDARPKGQLGSFIPTRCAKCLEKYGKAKKVCQCHRIIGGDACENEYDGPGVILMLRCPFDAKHEIDITCCQECADLLLIDAETHRIRRA